MPCHDFLEFSRSCQKPVKMKIGIIGGSGFYAMDHLKNVEERHIDTPFGKPSGPFLVGTLGDHEVVFLARHGPGHCIPPSALPHRANIYAMKLLGVDRILAITAVGSLKEECRPGDIVFADQVCFSLLSLHSSLILSILQTSISID